MTSTGLPEVPKGYTWGVYTQVIPPGVGFIVALMEPGGNAVGAEEFGMDPKEATRNDAQRGIYAAAEQINERFRDGGYPDDAERHLMAMADMLNLAGHYPSKTFIKAL